MKLDNLTPFGVKVILKLIELRMSNTEFCNKYGIPLNRFSEIINGLRKNEKHRAKIAKILGIEKAA